MVYKVEEPTPNCKEKKQNTHCPSNRRAQIQIVKDLILHWKLDT